MRKLLLVVGTVLVVAAAGFLVYQNRFNHHPIDSLESLKAFIVRGQERGYVPTHLVDENFVGPDRLKKIDLNFRTLIQWSPNARCPDHEDEVLLALSPQGQSVVCDAGDTAILLGDGNDWVKDTTGNDIILPGKGDDDINSGRGSDIIIFEPGWGHDRLRVASRKIKTDKIAGYTGNYPYTYATFLVFAQGIHRSDLVWDGNTLVDTKNGDSIALNTREVNLLFAEDSPLATQDRQFVAKIEEPKEISLGRLELESAAIRGNIGFFSMGNQGMWIVDLRDIKHPQLLSETYTPGRVLNIQLKGDLAFLSQGDQYLEGKKGWVSVVDVANMHQPKLLSTLEFANPVYSVAVAGNILYIPDASFVRQKGQLRVYVVTDPTKPQPLAELPLSFYAKSIAYLNKQLFLSSFRHGIAVVDVLWPTRPRLLTQYKPGKATVGSVKTVGDYIVLGQDESTLSVIAPGKNGQLKQTCSVQQAGNRAKDAMSRYDGITVHGNLVFQAQGREGVGVYQILEGGSCEFMSKLSTKEKFVSASFLVGDTLVAWGRKPRAVFEDLHTLLPQFKPDPFPQTVKKADSSLIEPQNKDRSLSVEQLQTLLYQAAVADDAQEVQRLCELGADPNALGHERSTPVEISAMLGKLDALRMLLEHGGQANGHKGGAMIYAALHEKFEAMKVLQEYGGNIGQVDGDGCTTLHYLAQDGTLEMVQYLVDNGVPVDTPCRGGETAETWAKYGKNRKVSQYLQRMRQQAAPGSMSAN
nr:ankyrin repeat domain-containing protein [uncultured Desulfobulbus sp.]